MEGSAALGELHSDVFGQMMTLSLQLISHLDGKVQLLRPWSRCSYEDMTSLE
jgi:hypothetical protein